MSDKDWADMSNDEKRAANNDRFTQECWETAVAEDAALKKQRDGVSAWLKKAGLKENASQEERLDAVELVKEAEAKAAEKGRK